MRRVRLLVSSRRSLSEPFDGLTRVPLGSNPGSIRHVALGDVEANSFAAVAGFAGAARAGTCLVGYAADSRLYG